MADLHAPMCRRPAPFRLPTLHPHTNFLTRPISIVLDTHPEGTREVFKWLVLQIPIQGAPVRAALWISRPTYTCIQFSTHHAE